MMKTIGMLIFLLSINSVWGTVVVVSDIDDTIKQTNLSNPAGTVYNHFKQKAFEQSRALYLELKKFYESRGEEVIFYYVSASQKWAYDANKWLDLHDFPKGEAIQKQSWRGPIGDYKYKTIRKILEKHLKDRIYLFGDNMNVDDQIYVRLQKDLELFDSAIWIRDTRTTATNFDSDLEVVRVESANYYFSELDLVRHRDFFFASSSFIQKIKALFKKDELIPNYIYRSLQARVYKLEKCKVLSWDAWKCLKRVRDRTLEIWENYKNTQLN